MKIEILNREYAAENQPDPCEETNPFDNPSFKLGSEEDPLPEHCHYRDEGCEMAGSCLSCPFSRCIYDEPGGKQRFVKTLRDREIGRLYRSGKEINELATMFGISQRTIHRALKRVENEQHF